ncbi:MAG: DUF427 domain-containing protein, partial [Pseudomonadota bacterium]
ANRAPLSPKAIWNGAVLAESDACRIVEGHYYFPPEQETRDLLLERCRKLLRRVVNGKVNCQAAWCYPQTSAEARPIQHYIAFWRGVKVVP